MSLSTFSDLSPTPVTSWCPYSVLCLLSCSNRVFTEGTCKLLNLVVTDLVDEDLVLNRRKQAASALLFGMVALVTKPGQTFAPLIGTWLLCVYTGKCPLESIMVEGGRPVSSVPSTVSWVDAEFSHLQSCDWSLHLQAQSLGERSVPSVPSQHTILLP